MTIQSQSQLNPMLQVANLLPPLNPLLTTKYRQLLRIFRSDDDRPHGDIFTDTQVHIVAIISKRLYPRTQLILPTQYGKSASVADGVLLRISTHKEKWAIVAPTEDKARIIMDYIIDRIFDDPVFMDQLEYHGTKDKLKQERSKTRISPSGMAVRSGFTPATPATPSRPRAR
jgi:hypothetical protein